MSVIEMRYLVGSPRGIRHLTESHNLGLSTSADMKAVFARAGPAVMYDKVGLTGRGLYIGKDPARRARAIPRVGRGTG